MTESTPEFGHLVAHEHGMELVCSCGTLLSIYGLTRSLHSVWAQHIREARESARAALTKTELAVEDVIALVECHPVRNGQTRAVTGYMLTDEVWREIRSALRHAVSTTPEGTVDGG